MPPSPANKESTKTNNHSFIASPHSHGGQLQAASQKYGIPLENWLDLSTGINPNSYPLPHVPSHVWQRLPEINDGLEKAATHYYGCDSLLPVAGSQEAIQTLPSCLSSNKDVLRVGIIKPAYHSHQQAWECAGHKVVALDTGDVNAKIETLDILIVVSPTNPSAEIFTQETLLSWHQQLHRKGGTLIVDEAFMDATPENSVISTQTKQGLIVLRSIGKFFGLAGLRLGFVWAEQKVLQALSHKQDDWAVSHTARWAGKLALADAKWQQGQRELLPKHSQRLVELLEEELFNKPLMNGGVYFNTTNQHVHCTALFAYFEHPKSKLIYQRLAEQGVLVRLFETSPALRFGLPANEQQWRKLTHALNAI